MRRRFFWSVLGTAALALGVVAVLGAVLTRASAVQATHSEITRQAAAVASLIDEVASVDGGVNARRLLELLREGQTRPGEDPGERFVRLLSSAQRVTGGSLVDLGWIDAEGTLRLIRNPGLTSALSFDPAGLVVGEQQFRRVQLPNETQALEVIAYPMEPTGAIVPVVVVGQRSDLIDWRRIMRGLMVPLALAAILAAVSARTLSGWLGRRLGGLAEAAHDLAEGNLSARADEAGGDEIAELAGSFNSMANRLEDVQHREREFLMSVGHDLRTPLTTIGGYAEALDEGELDEHEIDRIASVIGRETRRLHRLVEDLMLLARLEAREFTLRPEPVDVAAHLAEVAETYRSKAEESRIRFELQVDETGILMTDADRLAQILSNLAENALRYTPEAGRVTIAVARRDDVVELVVADSGPGIDPEDLPQVFEKFYVARRYRRIRPEGSGLGLAIVKELVEALAGSVHAVSEPGSGTKFVVMVPAMTKPVD
jgi:two-component system sensor histidine kinase BaeS